MSSKNIRYFCSHCQNRFEAEEKDIVECPKCFWTSSVKPEIEAVYENSLKLSQESHSKTANSNFLLPFIKIVLKFLLCLLIPVVFLYWYFYGNGNETLTKFWEQLRENIKSNEKIEVSVGEEILLDDGENQSQDKELVEKGLSDFDKEILNRALDLSAENLLSKSEKELLAKRVVINTGMVKTLPSDIWTLQEYKNLMQAQQEKYKVKLPKSYLKSLWSLFEEEYLPSKEYFEVGHFLKARDAWVASLAFPIYREDVQRHRGVILTMLRSFINDTLAKIGVVNRILVEEKYRSADLAVVKAYENLHQKIEAKDWSGALATVQSLRKDIRAMPLPNKESLLTPVYPFSFAKVDADIQKTLFDMQEVPLPSSLDFTTMNEDLSNKEQLLQYLQPSKLDKIEEIYLSGLLASKNEEWEKAASDWKQIKNAPEKLHKDLQEKLSLLS